MFLFNSAARKQPIVDETAAEKDTRENRYQQRCHRHLGRVSQLMTWLSFHKHHCALMPTNTHTYTHTPARKMRRGYKPPKRFNYAVKFYPNALVMLWSGEAAPSLGIHGAPWSGQRRKEGIPVGTRGRPRPRPSWGDQFRTLFSFSAFRYPSNVRKRKLSWFLPCFQTQLFLGTLVKLELNQSKMAAGRFIYDDPCDVPSFVLCVAKHIISAYHLGNLF